MVVSSSSRMFWASLMTRSTGDWGSSDWAAAALARRSDANKIETTAFNIRPSTYSMKTKMPRVWIYETQGVGPGIVRWGIGWCQRKLQVVLAYDLTCNETAVDNT